MHTICLPISKSIANRLLVRAALRGDVFPALPQNNLPHDVALLHRALSKPKKYINVDNCGTAMRFLTAFYAQKVGTYILLDGNERMRQRPIGQLVDALRQMGADIDYVATEGFPPLRIRGRQLYGTTLQITQTESTQFLSALLLIREQVKGELRLQTDITSPYITMTEQVLQGKVSLEYDWSSAAFWYEYVALHKGTTILLQHLTPSDVQGDAVVAELFKQFGVTTEVTARGICISQTETPTINQTTVDFSACPDLYPALFVTALRLGISLHAVGTERLAYKESNRLTVFNDLKPDALFYPSAHDHRVAMALLAADIQTDDIHCIAKSYPDFYHQLCTLKSSSRAGESTTMA